MAYELAHAESSQYFLKAGEVEMSMGKEILLTRRGIYRCWVYINGIIESTFVSLCYSGCEVQWTGQAS